MNATIADNIGKWYAKLVNWYINGGFTDEYRQTFFLFV